MNPLRKRFLEFMQFRCLSERTQQSYLYAVKELARHYQRSPEEISEEEIIVYINHLSQEKNLSFSTCNIALSAFKCFFNQFLGNGTIIFKVPARKSPKLLPVVLDQQEVSMLFQATDHPKKRIILMTAYGAGLRLSELMNLKTSDIDSQRMTIFVQSGKGRKDRYTILPKRLLSELRSYYQLFRPEKWIFYSRNRSDRVSTDYIQRAYRHAKQKAGIAKKGGIHTLRHCFATHLLENGTDIKTVQYLLGHANVSTTMTYLHVSNRLISRVVSPLEYFEADRKEKTLEAASSAEVAYE